MIQQEGKEVFKARTLIMARTSNVFVKPDEQSQTCLNFVMARKRRQQPTLLVKSEDAVKHINRINFLFHDHIGIDFRGVDVGMPQHLTCGVDVTSCCQNEGGKGMTAAMEGNGFVYSCFSCHTFATLILTAESDIYTTSEMMGHTNIHTTEIYTDVVMEKKVDAVNMLNGIF